jgi:hypothetical protein
VKKCPSNGDEMNNTRCEFLLNLDEKLFLDYSRKVHVENFTTFFFQFQT